MKVIFGALCYPRRKWSIDMSQCKFEYEILRSRNMYYYDQEDSSFTYPGLCRIISRENPSVIITNGFSIATMKLWLRSWFFTTPYIIWSGDIVTKGRSTSFLRKIQRRMLIKRSSGSIAYGKKAKEYLEHFGAAGERIQIGINTTDTEYYRDETEKHQGLESEERKKHLLCVGYMTKRKRLDQLFYIVKSLSDHRQDFVLQLVGSGPEIEYLRGMAEKLNIQHIVSFEGYKDKKDIARYLANADCFLFPSEYDIWGLVLVEAMSAGVTCLASIHAGATHDLISEGDTGFAVDFSETEKVMKQLNWILEHPEMSKEIGRKASDYISKNVSVEKSAEGFVKAIKESIDI